ncbi:unnamed protein product, partial [Rotaria magnacalcarata]
MDSNCSSRWLSSTVGKSYPNARKHDLKS